jgi:23S rRNA pseudouridine1911/1915/1917 synthase
MIYIADENDNGKRIDVRLAEILADMSRSKIQSKVKSGSITVNGASQKPSYSLKEDDEIFIPENDNEVVKIEPENIPIDIVWEDNNMAVINKPSGMLTHPTNLEKTNTLVNALLYRYGENLSDVNGVFRRGIVHRLDSNTSGLLMIAKNNETHEYLKTQIQAHNIEKTYRTIVKGVWGEDESVIDLPIGRNPKQPHKMMVTETGKPARSIVRVVKRYKEATALEVTIITGRTHQIRVHLSHMGHPIYNDTLYGAGKGKVNTEEQVLQSFKLRFTKPFSDEIISLEIPTDEKYLKVQNYFEGREK